MQIYVQFRWSQRTQKKRNSEAINVNSLDLDTKFKHKKIKQISFLRLENYY